MAAPALRNTIYSEFSDHAIGEDGGEFEREEFFTGERICPPRPRRGAVFKLLSWLMILGALYGGWVLWKDRPAWLETFSADAAALWSALSPNVAQAVQQEAAAQAPPTAPPEQAVAETESSVELCSPGQIAHVSVAPVNL